MSHPISMLLFLSTILLAVGCYGVYVGMVRDRTFGPLTGRNAQLFGLAHMLVGIWLFYGAVTNNTELRFGACMMMGKSKTCSWISST